MDTYTSRHRYGVSALLRLLALSSLLVGTLCEELASTHHTIEVSSLIPSVSCKTSSSKGSGKASSLKVAHKHGPCSAEGRLAAGGVQQPAHDEILREDQSRVEIINSRLVQRTASLVGPNRVRQSVADLPAKSGKTVGSGNYVVTVGLGTPKEDLTLIFDTGSDITWTQCKPCVRYCYQQRDPIFDPSASTSYLNISCTSASCSRLATATGNIPGCSSSTCVYGIQYGDRSFSVGFFGKEKLTITPTDTFDGFMFGCGQNNQGLFGSSAGLLGLGRDTLSIVEQTAAKYGRYFSYCLPSSTASTGYLSFGRPSTYNGHFGRTSVFPVSLKFTPLSTLSQSGTFYGITIQAVYVGGKKLSIPSSTFSNAPSIIDSGTVITRLPPTVYTALRDAFKQEMTKYPTAPALSILDTCYDFSNYTTVDIPKVGFSFAGDVYMDLHTVGIMYTASTSQVCLAFAANGVDTDVLIYGNVQQLKFEIVYDVGAMKLGFAPDGCA
ncbi:hypothetical protein SAY87_009596 [Trapa incisa]|uniref:Peptidase A1 domain-containing protein n=1 Tax=Trapa incisa TaxID=236973 RepID=A0AAN7PY52_9MYRT|nr:hypothetical protein SAY87_009596 [Trapa incisa]